MDKSVPSYIFRYEDLVLNPEPILQDCFKFLLDVDSIEGTVLEARIKKIAGQDLQSKSVYGLKNTTRKFNRNADMYNEDLMKELKEILKDYNLFMGYSNISKGEDDSTTFFNYEESEIDSESIKSVANRYLAHNANTLADIGKFDPKDKSFRFNVEDGRLMQEDILDPQLLTVKVEAETPTIKLDQVASGLLRSETL